MGFEIFKVKLLQGFPVVIFKPLKKSGGGLMKKEIGLNKHNIMVAKTQIQISSLNMILGL